MFELSVIQILFWIIISAMSFIIVTLVIILKNMSWLNDTLIHYWEYFVQDKRYKEVYGVRCPICHNEMIWGNDFSFEDYGMEGGGIVSEYSCSNCEVTLTIYQPLKDE